LLLHKSLHTGKKKVKIGLVSQTDRKEAFWQMNSQKPLFDASLFLYAVNRYSSLHYLKWYERLSANKFG